MVVPLPTIRIRKPQVNADLSCYKIHGLLKNWLILTVK